MTDLSLKCSIPGRLFPPVERAFPHRCRTLGDHEISTLVSNGCHCENWARVMISGQTVIRQIRNCSFRGDVKIHLPGGELFGTIIEDCSINGPAEVISNGILKGMLLMPGSSVRYCGSVVWTGIPGFLNGSIQAGLETGERAIPIIPEMDHYEAAFLASVSGRSEAAELKSLILHDQGEYFGYLGERAMLHSCPMVKNSIFLDDSIAEAASAVRGSLLLHGASVTDGAAVRDSVLQWNARVDSMAFVDESIVGEYSLVEKHGKLSSSFLGADCVLGEGEVTASLVGPLCGMHHQSLLIAALWPGGRGNIGYGANIGSNHTSRLPDQEIHPGTGTFFGLSSSVKFPCDLTGSPYTVIATGITTLPQRVEFPFSLITLPDARPAGIPEGWCRLVPGWMLHSNLYSVLRNEWKFCRRSRAVHTCVETSVFTEEIIAMVEDALERLESCSKNTIPGAGKNFITENDRLAGIQVYRKCIRTFSLLSRFGSETIDRGEACELLDHLEQVRESVYDSRNRDFQRGSRIFPDYSSVRCSPDEDPFILEMNEKMKPVVQALLNIKD